MKKISLLVLLVALISSCSDNDENNNSNDFFNLNDGNLWVYKKYNSNDNITYNYSNIIDTVRVTGDTIIDGVRYARVIHKNYYLNVFRGERKEFLRVDSSNHLVNSGGLVLHPGFDTQFQYVRNFNDIGEITHQLQNQMNAIVEGQNYLVYPYVGNYIPFNTSQPSQTIYYQYKEDVGMVCQHCVNPSGTSFYEDRLVYFELN